MPHHDPEEFRPIGSIAARLLQAESTSRLVSGLRKARRVVGWWAPSETNGFAGRLAPRAAESSFALVAELVTSSRLMAGLASVIALLAVIVREATVFRVCNEGLSAIRALARWQRVRLLGWMLAIAVLTHVLLARGDIVASKGTLLVLPAGALIVAIGLLWGSRTLASAWDQRRIGRPGSE
tara:strand:+ start:8715 stop:9257 length:543 start_codon:yes stop_codon:yes gene_type:complete